MAVLRRTPKSNSDAPPLWLPRHDSVVVEQSTARPADVVDGYTPQHRLTAALLGSRWKMATTLSTVAAALLFVALVPSLLGAGVGSMIGLAFYQAWTIGLLVAVTAGVRSIGLGAAARFWLVGCFLIAMIGSLVGGPIAGLVDDGVVWVTPIVEELLKAIPIGVAVFMGRRAWRHPGVADLTVLGFAVGAGYAFHEAALWERVDASGFGFGFGLLVPSMQRLDTMTVVGHGVWSALIAMAIGLLVLHRRRPVAAVAAVAMILLVLGDRMAANDTDGTLDVVRQALFNGRLTALVFLAAVVAAVLLDTRRLADMAVRDHLFPSAVTHGNRSADELEDPLADPLAQILVTRYRRLRNGVHTTVDATTQQWPPRSEAHPAPLAELARLGRAAGVAVGPGTSPYGWAADPENPGGHRYVGPDGFTAYAAGDHVVEAQPAQLPPPPAAPPAMADTAMPDTATTNGAGEPGEAGELSEAALDPAMAAALKAHAEAVAAHEAAVERALAEADLAASIGPTTTLISTPKVRPDAVGHHFAHRSRDYWQYVGVSVVGVALFFLVRLLTAGDASSALLDVPVSLADAPNSPALIVGGLGAIATAVSLRGRDAPELGEGWEVGPGTGPVAHRPDECEA